MLPDYPKAKAKLLSKLMSRMRSRARQETGPFAQMPVKQIVEGRGKWKMIRADGSVDDAPLKKFGAEMKISISEIENLSMGFGLILHKFDEVAESIGTTLSRHFYDKISKVTDQVGNLIDAKGKPFSPELFLKGLETIQIDFAPDGSPKLPTYVVHPSQFEQAKKVIEEAQTGLKFRKEYLRIIEEKRLDWRARESARKLVG